MKKYIPYIIGSVALIALIILLLNNKQQTVKRIDERVTFRTKDKIPYGTFVARNFLPKLFPNAEVYNDKSEPGYWDSISTSENNQAVILPGITFNASEFELENILRFVKKGNYVFIIAQNLSYDTEKFFNCNSVQDYMSDEDSIKNVLQTPIFSNNKVYTYPGRRNESFFSKIDTASTVVLGRSSMGYPNFIQLNAGMGSIFIHTSPLSFSNYFILHKNNVEYFQQSFSVIPQGVNKIVWDEYYLTKRREQDRREPSMLGVLMKHQVFRWALLTAIATLLIYVLMEMRRKQRMIPVIQKRGNDSLDFVKTIGMLYHDKKDHHNLAWKMSVYFLDHVRTNYKLSTTQLDENFIKALHLKSGYPVEGLTELVNHINVIQTTSFTTEDQLALFHKQLELFYQKT